MEPTAEQKTVMYRICQQLTKMYTPIYLALLCHFRQRKNRIQGELGI
ncbi:DUF6888 family protein [Fortiea sp. LEGE XX443]